MLHDPARHEPLIDTAWDAGRARAALAAIAADLAAAFTEDALWPVHPLDRGMAAPRYTCLYHGAAGVLWAQHHLAAEGAIAPVELRPDQAFSYKARFEVRPEIGEVKWEGFEVKRPSVKASDEMVDAEIENLRRQHATLQAPDPERPAKAGELCSSIHFSWRLGSSGLEKSEFPSGQTDVLSDLCLDGHFTQTFVAPGQTAERTGLLRSEKIGGRPPAAHGVSKRPVPQPGGVLVARHCDRDDSGEHLHPILQFLRDSNGPTHRAGSGRARAGGGRGGQDGTPALRDHQRRPG